VSEVASRTRPQRSISPPGGTKVVSGDSVVALLDERSRELLVRRTQSHIKGRGWFVRRMLLVADVVGLTAGFLVAGLAVGRGAGAARYFGDPREFLVFVLLVPLWVVFAKLSGLYNRDEERTDHSTTDDFVGVFVLVTLMGWFYTCGSLVLGYPHPDPVRLTIFWAIAIPAIVIGRALARALCRRHVAYIQNTVIVGAGDVGQLIAHKFAQHPEYGVNVVGFIDSEPRERRDDLDALTVLGSLEQLPQIVRVLEVERVIVAFSRFSDRALLGSIRSLNGINVQVDVVPRFFDVTSSPADVHTVEGLPLIGLPPSGLARSSKLIKRTFDVVLSVAGLIVLAPVFLAISVLIRLDSRGPVFFRQTRMGCDDGVFRIYKFRTMTADADNRKSELSHLNRHAGPGGDPRMFKISNDPRVTRVGKFLRRYSLDELPQLINVVIGEMSLVGPRPLILDEDAHVREWARRRLAIRPGMTGFWQVLGSSNIPFDEMIKLDYRYVSNWSLFLDIKFIFRTIPAVLRARSVD
jgi:exopolysaccharide biosynthesis polyprenyl glycosylphosphotransferase